MHSIHSTRHDTSLAHTLTRAQVYTFDILCICACVCVCVATVDDDQPRRPSQAKQNVGLRGLAQCVYVYVCVCVHFFELRSLYMHTTMHFVDRERERFGRTTTSTTITPSCEEQCAVLLYVCTYTKTMLGYSTVDMYVHIATTNEPLSCVFGVAFSASRMLYIEHRMSVSGRKLYTYCHACMLHNCVTSWHRTHLQSTGSSSSSTSDVAVVPNTKFSRVQFLNRSKNMRLRRHTY